MTKAVRIENADTSDHKLQVEVWEKGAEGTPDLIVETLALGHPTALVERHVHASRYLVVREVPHG